MDCTVVVLSKVGFTLLSSGIKSFPHLKLCEQGGLHVSASESKVSPSNNEQTWLMWTTCSLVPHLHPDTCWVNLFLNHPWSYPMWAQFPYNWVADKYLLSHSKSDAFSTVVKLLLLFCQFHNVGFYKFFQLKELLLQVITKVYRIWHCWRILCGKVWGKRIASKRTLWGEKPVMQSFVMR